MKIQKFNDIDRFNYNNNNRNIYIKKDPKNLG